MTPGDRSFVIRVTIVCLALMFVTMVGAMVLGLFRVEADHDRIVSILTPTFYSISGIFIGIATTLVLGQRPPGSPPPPPPPLPGDDVDH